MGVYQNIKLQNVNSHSYREIQYIGIRRTPLLREEPTVSAQCSVDEDGVCSVRLRALGAEGDTNIYTV